MSSMIVKGDHLWVDIVANGEYNIPSGCRVLSLNDTKVQVEDDAGHKVWINIQQILRPMHITSIRGVEDMISLGDLQEYAILRNLHMRYNQKLIYTYCGSMLIAVNPYEILPIYTINEIKIYQNSKINELQPHIFAIGDFSYRQMVQLTKNQCIVISGESGAGKTESTKLILQYLATISGKHSWIEQQILEANPILEAFGNAKTIRNDNSSRFGKYIEINFNNTGSIEGATIEHYLLEKSRIVAQNPGERNYHIFYSLLQGLSKDEKKKLELTDPSQYQYLMGGKTITCDGRNDIQEFADIKAGMKVLNFNDSEIWEIFKLLAAILHLGNLKYKSTVVSNMDAVEINDSAGLQRIGNLLGASKAQLVEGLVKNSIFVQSEKVTTVMNKEQAIQARNGFVKGIYGQLFAFIVSKINSAIYRPQTLIKNSIGVLDIFGFENFGQNSFEQLCINYANENLQQFFVQHIFKMEQIEYTNEGIQWHHIDFIDNQEILELIGLKPMNIMSLIDEESKFPKGSDLTMLSKLHATHKDRQQYIKPKSDLNPNFGIQHFAGVVMYDVQGFLEKNRDTFNLNLKQVIKQSENHFLKSLFNDVVANDLSKRTQVTLSSQFRVSLDILMKTLGACQPFFIRCIKPNEHKQPNEFDKELCLRQLRYSGMMETAKIRSAGYPIRYEYYDFVERFRHLSYGILPPQKADCRKSTEKICTKILPKDSDYQFGKTKVFLKPNHDLILEKERSRILAEYILILQRNIRRWIHQRRYMRMRKAALVIQKHWRARGHRQHYLIIKRGYNRLQAVLRSRQQTNTFQKLRNTIIGLQARSRGFLIRKFAKTEHFKKTLNEMYVDKENPKIDHNDVDAIVDGIFKHVFGDETSINGEVHVNVQNQKSSNHEDPIQLPKMEDIEEDLTDYNFRKFAATYFSSNLNHQYSKRTLKSSLLDLNDDGIDILAAQALWITILRFMGDLPEPRYITETPDNIPVMAQLMETLGRNYVNTAEYKEALRQEQLREGLSKTERQKLIHMTLKHKDKLSDIVRNGVMEEMQAHQSYQDWLQSKRTTNLEKLHFIIGHGILRPKLRDEIYCQICKQLTNNPTKASHARGWILLSLCIGCFPPSPHFVNYLKSFIRQGPPGYAPYCEERLNRTFFNGPRTQPPSWLELQATKSKKPILLSVSFMDDSNRSVLIDSATTSSELVKQLSDNIQLRDTFGFSIFITIFDKVLSLGSSGDHVMDAISQCEQFAKEQGSSERTAPWRLYLRKEIFAPWHDTSLDSISTNLIYYQIVRGIKYGEYRCNTDGDIAMLAAQQYYIDYGARMDPKLLHQVAANYLPTYLLKTGNSALSKWEKKIQTAFSNCFEGQEYQTENQAKENVVLYAKLTWPLLFSRYYEALKLSGPELVKNNIIIGVNWTGVYYIDDQEQILMELSFVEIAKVSYDLDPNATVHYFKLVTIVQEEYLFHTPDAKDLSELINYFIEGLKERSEFVVATQDYRHPGDAGSFLVLRKGDLITLEEGANGLELMKSTWGYGESNGNIGDFPTDVVHILPTQTQPPAEILILFKKDTSFDPNYSKRRVSMLQRASNNYTLEKFAQENFRSSIESNASRRTSLSAARRANKEELWRHTREPIKLPLLAKLQNQDYLSTEACLTFTAILKFMGDIPYAKSRDKTELTNAIFQEALKYDILRDEVYCQIMRQLTHNKIILSEQRGWQLMWLATGLFTCSQNLMKSLTEFLRTRNHPYATGCLQRLNKTARNGQRKYPPYIVEIEAIEHESLEIYHKVYFPDDNDEAFEVESSTKAGEICASIAKRLQIKHLDGFSLMVKIGDKVFSVPESSFFFDYIHELTNWMRKSVPNRTVQWQYQIFFMRKLWVNVVPGRDLNADLIFHFHQELPKYLRGYHKCSKQEAIRLAALLYRYQFETDDSYLNQLSQIIKELVPVDMVKIQGSADWKRSITEAYKSNKSMTCDDAKLEFLRVISQWPTFGSAFFEVKQTTETSYPELVVIGINRNGVSIIHPNSKDILITYGFQSLSNWSSGNTFFHMTVGNFLRGSKFLCETSLGYKMDDLITSYISYFQINKPF